MVQRRIIRLSKAFLALGCKRVRAHGVENLLQVLHDPQRIRQGRGVLTCVVSYADSMNRYYGALFSHFFRQGQTLETLRGEGIFQPALDQAIEKLGETRWVHIFPEGAVNLSHSTMMRRFKWGISRLVLEAPVTPIVLPIWLTGFDQIMPEPRMHPRWVPRLGADISVSFGKPVPQGTLQMYADLYTQMKHAHHDDVPVALPPIAESVPSHHLYPETPAKLREQDSEEYATIRSRLAAVLREELAKLGEDSRKRQGLGPGEGQLAHRPDMVGHKYKTDIPT